jgi:hypothetical protein
MLQGWKELACTNTLIVDTNDQEEFNLYSTFSHQPQLNFLIRENNIGVMQLNEDNLSDVVNQRNHYENTHETIASNINHNLLFDERSVDCEILSDNVESRCDNLLASESTSNIGTNDFEMSEMKNSNENNFCDFETQIDAFEIIHKVETIAQSKPEKLSIDHVNKSNDVENCSASNLYTITYTMDERLKMENGYLKYKNIPIGCKDALNIFQCNLCGRSFTVSL